MFQGIFPSLPFQWNNLHQYPPCTCAFLTQQTHCRQRDRPWSTLFRHCPIQLPYPTLIGFPTPWPYWLCLIWRTLHHSTLTCNHSNVSCLHKWLQQVHRPAISLHSRLLAAGCFSRRDQHRMSEIRAWDKQEIWLMAVAKQPSLSEDLVCYEERTHQQPWRHSVYLSKDARAYLLNTYLQSIHPSVRP